MLFNNNTNFQNVLDKLFSLEAQDDTDPELLQKTIDNTLNVAYEAARNGNDEAQFWLGYTKYFGFYNVQEDKEKGKSFLLQSAKADNFSALIMLAEILSGDLGDIPDYKEAYHYFERAKEQGDLYAQCRIAEMYKEGLFVEKDENEAHQLLKNASNNGSEYADLILGCWALSSFEEDDLKTACSYFQKGISEFSFETGNTEHYYKLVFFLGYCLAEGIGINKDLEAGQKYIEESSENGCEDAYNYNAGKKHPPIILRKNMTQNSDIKEDGVDTFKPKADERINETIGWKETKKLYKKIVSIAEFYTEKQNLNGVHAPHLILEGAAGSGKRLFASILAQKLAEINYLQSDKVMHISIVDLMTYSTLRPKEHMLDENEQEDAFLNMFKKAFENVENGIIVIHDTRKSSLHENAMDDAIELKAANDLYDLLSTNNSHKPLIILNKNGDDAPSGVEKFIKKNHSLDQLFRIRVPFSDFKNDELHSMFDMKITEFGLSIDPDAKELVKEEIDRIVQKNSLEKRNAHIVSDISFRCIENLSQDKEAIDNRMILTKHVPNLRETVSEESDAILDSINKLTGLSHVKEEIAGFVSLIKAQKARSKAGLPVPTISPHFIFTGDPGTGKTTVARMLGKILKDIGYLEKGHVVETDGTSMLGKYMGQTPTVVREKINDADGGILFIDEAYTLGQSEGAWLDSYREEAIATILKMMEDRRGRFIVIAAGYSKEMIKFLETNSGLKSRFGHIVDFENFTADELVQIFTKTIKASGYQATKEATDKLSEHVKDLKTAAQINEFGNARGIRNIIEGAIAKQAQRVLKDDITDQDEISKIYPCDLLLKKEPKIRVHSTQDIEKLLEPVNKLGGLQSVKDEVSNLVYLLQGQKLRGSHGLSRVPIVLHSIFTGPPGTGKTTVARMLGHILSQLGYLDKGHVVEVDKGGLTGQFLGETPKIVYQKAQEADGGILFVDEAYALSGDERSGYGHEALVTLLKIMEDKRNNFMVIAAGYDKEMKGFLESNSGLESRFSYHMKFNRYNPDELADILANICSNNSYVLDSSAKDKVISYLKAVDHDKLDKLGNARFMRNIFEKSIALQAKRIIQSGEKDQGRISQLVSDDIFLPSDKNENAIGFIKS